MSLLLLSAFLMAADPVAPPAPATTPAPQAQQQVKAERKICKRQMVTTSLHGSKRVCLTASEWRVRNGEGGDAESIGSAVGSRGH
jgi:hypothetical protein